MTREEFYRRNREFDSRRKNSGNLEEGMVFEKSFGKGLYSNSSVVPSSGKFNHDQIAYSIAQMIKYYTQKNWAPVEIAHRIYNRYISDQSSALMPLDSSLFMNVIWRKVNKECDKQYRDICDEVKRILLDYIDEEGL